MIACLIELTSHFILISMSIVFWPFFRKVADKRFLLPADKLPRGVVNLKTRNDINSY